jgi:hypothetical protein
LTDYLSLGTTEGDNNISFVVDPMNSAKVSFTPIGTTVWVSYKLDWSDSNNPTQQGLETEGPPDGFVGTSAEVRFDTITLVDTVAGSTEVFFASPWTEQEIRELQVDRAPGLNEMYYVVRSDTVSQKLTYSVSTGIWTFAAVSYTNPPATWATTGYPGSVGFHKGRMYLGGSRGHPITIWGSKAGEDNFEDYDFGTALDDEALELPLARDGVLQWLQGGNNLFVGSDAAEHVIIGEPSSEPITPTGVDGPQQSSYGSTRIHGQWLSEKLAYVSNDRKRVYLMQFNRDAQQRLSDEITFQAEHITAGLIQDISIGQNPRGHIWCSLQDGNLVGSTFQRETDTKAWFRYSTEAGNIKSLAIAENYGISVLWTLVVRNDKLYLERTGTQIIDSHIVRDYQAATSIIDGLDHLEGLGVQVLSGGAYAGTYLVDSGEVVVNDQFENTSFVVGLGISSTLKTLPIDLLSPTDSIASKLLRWNKIYVRLTGLRPNINGQIPPDRKVQTAMDSPDVLHDDMNITGSLGRDRDGQILLTQDLPFATEILGLFGELQQDGI